MAIGIAHPDLNAGPDLDRMSLVAHLVELRQRVLRIAVTVGLAAVAAWFLYPLAFSVLLHPYRAIADHSLAGGRLLATGPLEGFSVRIKITTYLAIALAMPMILWQTWRFVAPGLYQRERRYAVPFVTAALTLFTTGAAVAYWTLPKALEWLAAVGGSDITQAYTADKYFQLIAYTMVAFGIAFEFPILLVFLQLAGVVTNSWLRAHWRHAIVAVAVVVGVATPSNDPISMFALCVPLWIFYGVAVLIGAIIDRRRSRVVN